MEIPLTYYLFGDDSGFTMGDGVIILSGDLTFTDNQTITIPSDMKLVIEDGITIDVGVGNKLTIDGVVETEGDLTIKGDLVVTNKFTVDGDLAVKGDLRVSGTGFLNTKEDLSVEGDFKAEPESKVVVDSILEVENETNIEGQVKVGALTDPPAGETELEITIDMGGSLEVPRIADTYDKVTVSGGGTLKINSETTLEEVVLKDDSRLEIVGSLKGEDDSGIIVSGDGTLAADSINVSTIDVGSGETVTLIGDVSVEAVTGYGRVEVEGTLIANQLSIDNGATLEALSLKAEGDSVTVSGGGEIKVNSTTTVGELEIQDNSSVIIDGRLESGTITGDGTLKAGSIDTDTLSSTDNLEVTAYPINTTKIGLSDQTSLVINGSVTTEEISGDGSLEISGGIGTGTEVTIKGSPTVTGDLNLEPDTTLSFVNDATLEVTGEIKAWGDLTFTGAGELDVTGDLTVAGSFEDGGVVLYVGGDTYIDTVPIGKMPHLALYIKSGETIELENIEAGWETVTVTGGGTLVVNSVDTTLGKITLEDGSNMEVEGDFILSDEAELSLSEGTILAVTGDVEAEGDLVLTGEGRFDIIESFTVEGDFSANANVYVEDELDVGGDLDIEKTVTVGSLSMDKNKTLEIGDDGSLNINNTGRTELGKVVLGDNAMMDVAGDLKSDEISGGGNLTADSIEVTTINTENGKTLILNSDITTENISGDGFLEARGDVGTEGEKITIEGSPTVTGDLNLKAGTTLSFDSDATLEVTGDVEATGDLTLTGTGKLHVKGDLNVADTLINSDTEIELFVTGETSVKFKVEGEKPNLEVYIEPGETLELENIEAGWETVTVTGGGALIVNGVNTTLDKIILEDSSKMEVTGDLEISEISGSGNLAAENIEVTTINTESGQTLTLEGSVSVEAVTGNGTAKVEGAVTVDNLSINNEAILEVSSLEAKNGDVTLTGGGTLIVNGVNTTLDKIILEDSSKMEVTGDLEISEISGSGNLTAENIKVTTINTESGQTLALEGSVSVEAVTGSGTAKVEGVVTVDDLLIANGATLEVEELVASNDSVTLSGGGELKVNSNTTVGALELGNSSFITIDGTLKSDTISGHGTLVATNIDVETIITESGKTLTLNGDVTTEVISGDGILDTQKIVGGGEDGKVTIEGSPTIEEDLILESNTTLFFDNGATLTVEGDVKAWGDLTLTGEGELDAKKNVLVESVFTSDSDVNVTATELDGTLITGELPLGEKPDLTIYIKSGEDYSLDSIEDGWETVLVTGGGTLKVNSVNTTLEKITLENGSKLEIQRNLTLSEKAELSLSEGAALTVTGDVVAVGDITLSGEVSVGSFSMDENNTLEIGNNSSFNINDIRGTELSKVVLGDNATMNVTGDLKSSEISGSGDLTADNIEVTTINTESGKTLTLNGDGDVEVTKVTSSGTAKVVGAVTVTVGELTIEPDATLEASSVAFVGDTLKVTGGGTLIVDSISADPESEKFAFNDNSTLEIGHALNIKEIEISGDGNLVATSIVADTLSSSGNQTITTDTIVVPEIVVNDGKTLTLVGDVTTNSLSGEGSVAIVGTVSGTDLTIGEYVTLDISNSGASLTATGDVTLEGTLALGATGWGAVNFSEEATITLVDESADLKINGVPKWYSLDGAKAKYSFVDNEVELAFIPGNGDSKATPAGIGKTPTEVITRVTSGVTFETPNNRNNFYLKVGEELIVEDGGIFDAGAWWFSNFNSGLFKGSIIIKSEGNFKWRDKLVVGDLNQEGWDAWAWKQDGTITEIDRPDTQWKFTTKSEGGGNNEIDISFTGDVNTPIEIGEGVTATVSTKLKQNNSTLTIIGTVIVTGNLEIAQNNGIVFGAKDAGLIIKPAGKFNYSTNAWLSSTGVGSNGFVQIEGGSFVTLSGTLWFGPSPSNTSSYFNLGSNLIVEIGAGQLTASKKDASINEGNIVSMKYIGTRFATPGLKVRIEKGVQFNVADCFVSRGDLEIEDGGLFTIGIAGIYAVAPGKSLTINGGASFEILGNGKMMKLGSSSQYFGGTVDIKDGATVNVGGKTEPDKSTTYSGKITYHTVRYNNVEVFKHQ